MSKRCIFCGKRLDKLGRCRNQDCPDFIRTQILDDADAEKAENPTHKGDNNQT